jgi:hypothetical protein
LESTAEEPPSEPHASFPPLSISTESPSIEYPPKLGQLVTSVDPDARLGKKFGQRTLGYKDHRSVDDRYGIVTTTITTPANVPDDKLLMKAVEFHEQNTQMEVKTVVADTIYGTRANYHELRDQHKSCCIPHQRFGIRLNDAVSYDKFHYDVEHDCYLCPTGHILNRYDHKVPRDGSIRYRIDRSVCEGCPYFEDCVKSKTRGRQILRNPASQYFDWADQIHSPARRRYWMSRRLIRAEGSFADASNNHGFKRSRWRGLMKMEIQNLLIAAIQNLRKLLGYCVRQPQRVAFSGHLTLFLIFFASQWRRMKPYHRFDWMF